MRLTDRCPACLNTRLRSWPALISSFARIYAVQEQVHECRLCECRVCGMRFFDQRYAEEEMRTLYDDYRGERYVRIRSQCEPEYDNELAAGDVLSRQADLDAFLTRHLGRGTSDTVLDFGGDDGRFIPQFFVGRRLVYDVSNKPLASTVERVRNLADLAARPPRYVLLSDVLEHLPEPVDVLKTIARLIDPEGLIYVEVPNEGQRLRWRGAPRVHRRIFNYLINRPIANGLISLLIRWSQASTAPRSDAPGATHQMPPRLFDFVKAMMPRMEDLRLHEHINFFTAKSLNILLQRAGFEPRTIELDGTVWRVLAAPTPSTTQEFGSR
jgi:hypothetical protein